MLILMSTWTVLKDLVRKDFLIENVFRNIKRQNNCVKDGTTGDNGEKLNGHISDKNQLTCKKIWN